MTRRNHKTVLFLCTGNYHRSRFAEVLFNSVAGKMGLHWQASSRGLALERGINNVGPMAVSAVKSLEALGVRSTAAVTRFPAQVTTDDLEAADRIVALKQAEHLPLLQERFPVWAEKVEFWHVDDAPVLALIEQEVMGLVARILGGGNRADMPVPDTSQPATEPPKKPMTVRVGRETKGRRGKGVTTVSDVPLDEAGLLELAGRLKQALRHRRHGQGRADRDAGRPARATCCRTGRHGLQGKAGRGLTCADRRRIPGRNQPATHGSSTCSGAPMVRCTRASRTTWTGAVGSTTMARLAAIPAAGVPSSSSTRRPSPAEVQR